MKAMRTLALAAAILTGAVSAHATLHDRGGGMIYDDELDITWLQNWNQIAGSNLDQGGGRMNVFAARDWADTLEWGGFSDWRLPTMSDTGAAGCDWSNAGGTDCGYNVQTKSGGTVFSEMAHLWYVTLGNKGRCDPATSTASSCVVQPGWGLSNTGPFINVQPAGYWSGLAHALNPLGAWYFESGYGFQTSDNGFVTKNAVAVRSGDVAAIPEPPTVVLMMLGVGAVVARRMRRPE